MTMQVPLVDLRGQHQQLRAEIEREIARVCASANFVLGEEVARFEAAFARFTGVAHCVGVGNGTDALEIILRACNIGPGDEVILPANTFVATALAVARTGARPVLIDCEPRGYLIDAAAVADRCGARTAAILPVHLYGQMADMETLSSIASARGLRLVEDAAQAHGARRNGRPAGSWGEAAGVSFYPSKNLGAYGDAGAVITASAPLAERMRILRNYGSREKYVHEQLGVSSRLDALQAAVLLVKLTHLAEWNRARRRAATRYDELLAGAESVQLPETLPGNEHVWHLYVVRVPRRDTVLRRLHAAGVDAGIHYPLPLHLQRAFDFLGHQRGAFPVAEAAAGEILSLPLFPEISESQQQYVADQLQQALER